MKRVLTLIIGLIMAVGTAFGQTTAVESSRITDNIYLGVGGQVSTPLDFNSVFPLNHAAAVTIGKEITPVVGVNIEDNVWFTSNPQFDGDIHNLVRGNYLGLNGTINLTYLFNGLRYSRVTFQTVTGLGWWHTFTPNASDITRDDLAAKTGLNINFKFSPANWIYIQPAVLWNLEIPGSKHDNIAFNKHGGQLALQIGFIHHFKNKNGGYGFKVYNIDGMNQTINDLRAKLAEKPNEVIRTHVVEKVVNEPIIINPFVVNFAQGSSFLTEEAKEKLSAIPENSSVRIVGFTSPEGSDEFNKKLSKARADAVQEYIISLDKGIMFKNVYGKQSSKDDSQRTVEVTIE